MKTRISMHSWMRSSLITGVLVAAIAGAARGQPPASPRNSSESGLTAEQFTRLHLCIKPKPREWKWAQIPWQTNLHAARQQAAREGKPLYLWIMVGNPMTCS